jgi:beta-galactosidase GanA
MFRGSALFALGSTLMVSALGQSVAPPTVHMQNGASQLLVQGKPYLVLGGELANSSAGTAAQADEILPRMRALHTNTVLMPVAWEQIEPREGSYDFTILDHWIDTARQQQMHLVLLWFGSWKNAFSEYAPVWVKADAQRFPRAIAADGQSLEILSTFGQATLDCDARAFAQLMRHVREKDAREQTVLMVQVENEVGYLGAGRDRSKEANALFQTAPPAALLHALSERRMSLAPELAAQFNPAGKSWREAFGNAANEAFMAWRYATFIDKVAEAGKQQYALPLYTNAQLPAPDERAGEYPSGAPHPYNLDIYRATATHIDMFSPDIYWPDYSYWIKRYQLPGNAIFVPESRLEAGALNALYTIGEARALGFSPFDIDHVDAANELNSPTTSLQQSYEALQELSPLLPAAQAEGRTRALVLHANSPRATQTIALGGYLFEASLSRSWPAHTLLCDDGGMLVLQSGENEFFVAGRGLTVSITRDPDAGTNTAARIAGIASIETVEQKDGQWVMQSRLNGDESDQGRKLLLDPHQIRIYRVELYSNVQEQHE